MIAVLFIVVGALGCSENSLKALEPMIRVTPASHDYGIVLPDTTSEAGFQVANYGSGTLVVDAVVSSDDTLWTVDLEPTSLGADEAEAFTVTHHGNGA
ncbi:MAG: hypothetical protein QGG40_20650, partial [Myxococcota bacterium]|nr:hypothetical protein [Myxococcota bacterium]